MVETDQFRGVTELTVVSPDHPRLLAIVTGACAAAGGNIVDAHIFTTADGMALDTIFVSRAFETDEDELRRGERVASGIERALKGEVRIGDLVDIKRPSKERPNLLRSPPRSSSTTPCPAATRCSRSRVSTVRACSTISPRPSEVEPQIASAHVATFGEKAVDVFYVTDLTGTKVSHPGRQASIRRALLEVFEADQTAERPLRAGAR
jgi:[protein-PII] uridylyltransferase